MSFELLTGVLQEEWAAVVELTPRIAVALLVFLIALAAGRLLARGARRVTERSDLSEISRTVIGRLISWSVLLFGLVAALNVVGLKTAAAGLLAGGGMTAVVLGFAFREIGENFVAGVLLAFDRPFEVDDLIESGSFKGTVRAIDLRHTHVRASDGRDIFIPNARIFKEPLVNYTRDGLSRPTFEVQIDQRDDAAAACRVLDDVIRSVPDVAKTPEPVVRVADLGADAIVLEVRFWVDTLTSSRSLLYVKSEAIDSSRRVLTDQGYRLHGAVPHRIELQERKPEHEKPA